MSNDVHSAHGGRDDVLNAVSDKWKRLSRQEISALKSSRELVALVVAKYGIRTNAARRDVEALRMAAPSRSERKPVGTTLPPGVAARD